MPGLRALFGVLALLAGGDVANAASPYLFVWGMETRDPSTSMPPTSTMGRDFVAVFDVRPNSRHFGKLLAMLPVGGGARMAHHTNYQMPADGQLFASDYMSDRNYIIDLSNALRPRVSATFANAGAFTHAHSFARLPNGHTLATFQFRGKPDREAGALVEIDPTGKIVRASDAADPNVDPFIRPYSLVALPRIDRVVTTSADMLPNDKRSHVVQVWRLSDLKLLKSVILPKGPHYPDIVSVGATEPRVLADGKTVLVVTGTCGLYRLSGVEGTDPSAQFVYDFGSRACGVPTVVGHYWIQTTLSSHSLTSLDVSDPSKPREAGHLALQPEELPHWVSREPGGNRLVITGYGSLATHALFASGMRARVKSVAAVLWVLALAPPVSAASPHHAVRAWREAHEKAILTGFTTFLSLPNVATNVADVEKNAAYIEAELKKRGFQTKTLSAGPGTPPSVFAEYDTPGAKRTVLFYAHYDGQPVSQKGWIINPFTPSVRTALPEAKPVDIRNGPLNPDWRVYARGSGDDKGSIQALISAFDALKASGIKPSVNIKLLYEGEEEQGSPHFGKIVELNRNLLKADALIMGDGPMHQSGRQMVGFGNRGIVGFTLTVYGPIQPLHDGHYGSFAPSPSVMLAHLIASLRDDDGKILIPGIYDDVIPATAADEAAIAAMPPIEAQLKRSLGLGRSIGPARLAEGYLKPTLNVRSIHVGDEGPNAANAIATDGFASLDIRLVPGETPARVHHLVESYLTSLGWTIVRTAPDLETRLAHPKLLKLNWDAGESIAAKTRLDLPAARAVVASIGRTVGYAPIELPTSGGSSGIAEAVDQLHTPMIGVSIANFDDNQHARNENLRLGNLWDGIEVYAGLLADLDWGATP